MVQISSESSYVYNFKSSSTWLSGDLSRESRGEEPCFHGKNAIDDINGFKEDHPSTLGNSDGMLFFAFPYGQGSQPMAILSLIFYFLNICLFVLFHVSTLARFVLEPEAFIRQLKHPSYSLFFSCYPMGATTILNVSINVIYAYYGIGGRSFVYLIWALWWINIAVSALCFWGCTYLMITRHSHSLPAMTAAWILPVVTFVVASSTGAIIAEAVRGFSAHSAFITVTVSAFLLTLGLLLASMMLTVYILRLVVYGFPPGLSVLSVFLPLGVSAQASYSISLIGAEFQSLIPLVSSQSPFFSLNSSPDTILIFCTTASFILWSWAVLWISYAVLGLLHVLRKTKIQFKLTAWGLVFPNGVFANLTIHLADVFNAPFFRVVGAIYSVLTFLLWCYISYNSLLMVPSLFKTTAHPTIPEKDEAIDPASKSTPNLPSSQNLPRSRIESVDSAEVPGYEDTVIG
ncbi:hypothetical protein NP233_g4067 [Leucocoprinus birnbaumii]|uniref:Sulfite efflux pump SSU1 n=1 Tax=Leucocoprinus birnbaumii TaxID=56174 RepID=A0AAD5VW44_9AGAR|nr:hypothetical protein NP233_g4067 [Leucocoprinus birnbaumii]